jgi:GAF domain-containing protein
VLGTLSFGAKTRTRFNEDELSLMKVVADQVAVAMDRIRSQEALAGSEQAASNGPDFKAEFRVARSDGEAMHMNDPPPSPVRRHQE